MHVVTNCRTLFFVKAASCSIACVCHFFFIHSSTDGQLGYFLFLAIENNAAMNMIVEISFQDSDFNCF